MIVLSGSQGVLVGSGLFADVAAQIDLEVKGARLLSGGMLVLHVVP